VDGRSGAASGREGIHLLRVHMTAEDLARVRLLPAAGPIAETMHSLAALPRRSGRPRFDPWRRRVHAAAGPTLSTVGALAPPHAIGLDLLGICGVRDGFEEAAEALLEAEPGVLRFELDHLEGIGVRLPAAFADLADADAARHRLVEELRRYYRLAVEPVWGCVRAGLDADGAARALIMAREGVDGLLGTLHPDVMWRHGVLTVTGCDGDLHLAGRGLAIAPSYFVLKPVLHISAHPDMPAVLVHPTMPAAPARGRPAGDLIRSSDAVEKLVGRTRATVLSAIAGGTTTTGGIAVLTGTTTAAVSQHLAVLRDAKLIVTARRGPRVDHLITSLGRDLLGRS
jgi:DNA-binding transcriptional ArsR family regulator